MSIYSEIAARVNEHRLFALSPLMPPNPGVTPRHLFVSPEINALFNGPWHSRQWMSRCFLLRADLDRFSQGGLIPIATRPLSKGNTAYMRQLFRWREEVWEIRSRGAKPGIRVLGRFADTDVFIALTWHKRPDLRGPKSRAWRNAIVGCKTEWRNLFPAYAPRTGDPSSVYPTDYISANTYLV
jgi:hypothetical protein